MSYSNNTKPGTAKVTVLGKGGYKSSTSATFTIIPKKAALSSLKGKKKKQLTITWKKDSTITGYEVEYSTSSSFWSYSTTTKTVKNKTSLTVKNLNSKTFYYVRIREYKTINGEKVYGEYSVTKSKKVK